MENLSNENTYVPEELFPSDEEIAIHRDKLIEYYSNMPGFKKDPIEKANSIIEICKKGWTQCPKTFEARVKVKSRMRDGKKGLVSRGIKTRAKSAVNLALEKQYDETHKKAEKKFIEDHIGLKSILDKLDKDDKRFLKQRWVYYNKEFEINTSSDYALLMEVLVDELEQKRIAEARITCDPTDHDTLSTLSKTASECLVRLEKSLKSLGVTREQRKDELDDGAETIAELALQVDKKLKKHAVLEKMRAVEEEEMLKVKFNQGDTFVVPGLPRPVHNRIPDIAEIVKIAKATGMDNEVNE